MYKLFPGVCTIRATHGALGRMDWPFTIVSAQPLSVSFAEVDLISNSDIQLVLYSP